LDCFLWYILEELAVREQLIILVKDKLRMPALGMVNDQIQIEGKMVEKKTHAC
jgi:hypothetical protein